MAGPVELDQLGPGQPGLECSGRVAEEVEIASAHDHRDGHGEHLRDHRQLAVVNVTRGELVVEGRALHGPDQGPGVVVGVRAEPRGDVELRRAVDVSRIEESALLLPEGPQASVGLDEVTGRADQHQAFDPIGLGARHLLSDIPAVRRPHQREGGQAQVVHERQDVLGIAVGRTRLQRGGAVATQVAADHPAAGGDQRGGRLVPHPQVRNARVHEDDRRTVALDEVVE